MKPGPYINSIISFGPWSQGANRLTGEMDSQTTNENKSFNKRADLRRGAGERLHSESGNKDVFM